MYKESPEVGATSLRPEGYERMVTFENVASPRNTIRRLTLIPRDESKENFEVTPRRPKSPYMGYTEDGFQVSQLSIDVSGCCNEDLSSAAQMASQGRVTRDRLYEKASPVHEGPQVVEKSCAEYIQTIFPKMLHHLTPRKSSTEVQTTYSKPLQLLSPSTSSTEVHTISLNMPNNFNMRSSVAEAQATGPKMLQHLGPRTSTTEAHSTCPTMMQRLSPRTSSGVQTNLVGVRPHADLRLVSSKTTLLSLADAGVCSASRLSSPTPSDIPSPPPSASPSASPNRLTLNQSHAKVDVAVGIKTVDSEPVLPASCDLDGDLKTIEIPVSSTGIRFCKADSSAFQTCANFNVKGKSSQSLESRIVSNLHTSRVFIITFSWSIGSEKDQPVFGRRKVDGLALSGLFFNDQTCVLKAQK